MNWLSDRSLDRLREEVDLPDFTDGKYRVIRRIGSGGMGTVYLAQDSDLGRKVALKVMSVSDARGELASRMLREARIVALLEHPSIVPIHDVGTLKDGRVFYAMKLVQGSRLDQYSAGLNSLPEQLRIFQKVCEAVAFAHVHGVVHRDLKPENIMVGPFGEVLVMDWGVAKVLSETRESYGEDGAQAEQRESPIDLDQVATLPIGLSPDSAGETVGGTVIGTPAYMSPEQACGETELIDQRSDVYALGGILYFLLTGRPPLDARDLLTGRQPIKPRQVNSKIPRRVEAIALKALSRDRDKRYESGEQIAGDVVRFLDGQPVSAYRENVIEIAGRWINQNRFLVVLVVAYLLMRLIVFFSLGN